MASNQRKQRSSVSSFHSLASSEGGGADGGRSAGATGEGDTTASARSGLELLKLLHGFNASNGAASQPRESAMRRASVLARSSAISAREKSKLQAAISNIGEVDLENIVMGRSVNLHSVKLRSPVSAVTAAAAAASKRRRSSLRPTTSSSSSANINLGGSRPEPSPEVSPRRQSSTATRAKAGDTAYKVQEVRLFPTL